MIFITLVHWCHSSHCHTNVTLTHLPSLDYKCHSLRCHTNITLHHLPSLDHTSITLHHGHTTLSCVCTVSKLLSKGISYINLPPYISPTHACTSHRQSPPYILTSRFHFSIHVSLGNIHDCLLFTGPTLAPLNSPKLPVNMLHDTFCVGSRQEEWGDYISNLNSC